MIAWSARVSESVIRSSASPQRKSTDENLGRPICVRSWHGHLPAADADSVHRNAALLMTSGYLCSMCEIGEHCKGESRQVCLCSCADDEEPP